MAHPGGAPTKNAGYGGPRSAAMLPPSSSTPANHTEKRDLASWWKGFKSRDREKKVPEQPASHGIFGIPLQESIRYANVAISLLNDQGQSYIYGYVPIIVAKCGVFLKEKATDVEGIFRLAGSEKRIKELKATFDSPDRFGKGLDWTGYTVHDAANILRRYFNQLPEPIIPLEFYEPFRDPLKNHQEQAVGALDAQSPSVGNFDQDSAIRRYQRLITELPPLNRQLLLYILDLLAVFASKSDLNKMTTANLAAIFQPGTLSHPQHDMAPQEYRLSQDVLIFLIENQDSFLIGMQGTGADAETLRDIESGGTTPPKPSSSSGTPKSSPRSGVDRSTSNASAGAEGIRKWGSLRRNVSVSSSKNSKRSDGGPIPVGTPTTPTNSGGVHRSNTVPSRRGGSNSIPNSPRFSKELTKPNDTTHATQISTGLVATAAVIAAETSKPRQESIQNTPISAVTPRFSSQIPPPPEVVASSSSSDATATMTIVAEDNVGKDMQTPKRDSTPLLLPPGGSAERTSTHTPSASSGRGFLDIFKQSPTSDIEPPRKPNKLQKKRIPGSNLSSAQSSNQDLNDGTTDPRMPSGTILPAVASSPRSPSETIGNRSSYMATPTMPAANVSSHRESIGATLRATSPTNSYRSTNGDTSDADFAGDDLPRDQVLAAERDKKRHRWRFSRTQNRLEPSSPPSGESLSTFGNKELATSRSTVGSSAGGAPRRSFQEPTPLSSVAATSVATGTDAIPGLSHPTSTMQSSSTDRSNTDHVFSDSEREKKGPMRWIRGKIQEHKDKEAERRARTTSTTMSASGMPGSSSALATANIDHRRADSRDRLDTGSQTALTDPAQAPPPQQLRDPQALQQPQYGPRSGRSFEGSRFDETVEPVAVPIAEQKNVTEATPPTSSTIPPSPLVPGVPGMQNSVPLPSSTSADQPVSAVTANIPETVEEESTNTAVPAPTVNEAEKNAQDREEVTIAGTFESTAAPSSMAAAAAATAAANLAASVNEVPVAAEATHPPRPSPAV